MGELGNVDRRVMGRWLNNRIENSHLPFRRRERAMLRFWQMKTLQKFASVHASLHNHLYEEGQVEVAQVDIFRPFSSPVLDTRYKLDCMTRLVTEPIQLIYGQLREELHQDPACGGLELKVTKPFFKR